MTSGTDKVGSTPRTKAQCLEAVVEELNLDTKDPFTCVLAAAFALQDAYDESRAALARAQQSASSSKLPDIPSIIRRSTWRTPELRESAARLVENILRPDDSPHPPVPPDHFPVA